MKEILVKNRGRELNKQIETLIQIFTEVDQDEQVFFDIQLDFAYPLVVLPLAAYIHKTKSKYSLVKTSQGVRSYLQTISFPNCVERTRVDQRRGYIPLHRLPNSKKQVCFNQGVTNFTSLIERVYQFQDTKHKTAVHYPISEMIDNIDQHSGGSDAYLAGQYYANRGPRGELHLCIVDSGIGVAESYRRGMNSEYTHKESLHAAMNGESAKDSHERGTGIHQTSKIICEGFGGSHVLITGNSIYLGQEHILKTVIELEGFYWGGVIHLFRIPNTKDSVNIYRFVN